jgi:SNF2 family DNA or RNA helicase
MISPIALKRYRERRLDDHSWLKRASARKVNLALSKLRPAPRFQDLRLHQRVGLLLGITYPQFFFLYDMGSGKTALSLRLIEYLVRIGKVKGIAVVLVPNDAAIWNWEDEIKKWSPRTPYRLLTDSSSKDKWHTLGVFKNGIAVVSYPGYRSMISALEKSPKAKHAHRALSATLAKKFSNRAGAMVMDEITACKNPKSLTFKAVETLSKAVKFRYGLTGRPFGRDPAVLWAQCFLVDHGETFSQNFQFFHEAYFKKKKSKFGYGSTYSLSAKGKREVSQALKHRSLSYSVQECLELPPLIPITRKVEFPPDAMIYYRKMVEALIQQKGNWREIKNVFLRMRQIASGFVGMIDDDTGERAQIEFRHNPKIDELMNIIVEEKPENEKCVVFHEYNWTGQRICTELSRNKIRHGWLHGGTKNWVELKDRFNSDPNMEVLVVNWKKGGMALNLQAASVSCFIESPVAPDQREQCERRTWRGGQTKHVRQYDILVKNSVDERIRDFHKEGDDLMNALIRNPRKALGLLG